MALHLSGGASGDPQKSDGIVPRVPTAAFGDVRRNGQRGAAQLSCYYTSIRTGKAASLPLDGNSEGESTPPYLEPPKIVHETRMRASSTETRIVFVQSSAFWYVERPGYPGIADWYWVRVTSVVPSTAVAFQ